MLDRLLNGTYHRRLIDQLLENYRHLLDGKVLDIGSKNRRYDPRIPGDVTAVDVVPNTKRRVHFGDIERGLDFPDRSFNAVVCIEVFEYLKDYDKAIQEIHRLLMENGHAVISIPFLNNDHRDKIRYTESFIASRLTMFSSVRITRIGNGFIVIWDILRKKAISIHNIWLRRIALLCILPYYFCIVALKLHTRKDDYYSGLFILAKK